MDESLGADLSAPSALPTRRGPVPSSGPALPSGQNPYFLQREFSNAGVIESDPNAPACAAGVSLAPTFIVPSAVDLGLVLLAGIAVVAGFWLVVGPVRKRHFAPVVGMLVAPASLAVAGLTIASRRLAVSGTYAQFHGDFGTQPIASSPLGHGVLVMGVLLVLAVGWTTRALARMAAESGR